MPPNLSSYAWIVINSLCATAHKEFCVAELVMWSRHVLPQSTGPSDMICAT